MPSPVPKVSNIRVRQGRVVRKMMEVKKKEIIAAFPSKLKNSFAIFQLHMIPRILSSSSTLNLAISFFFRLFLLAQRGGGSELIAAIAKSTPITDPGAQPFSRRKLGTAIRRMVLEKNAMKTAGHVSVDAAVSAVRPPIMKSLLTKIKFQLHQ